MSGPAGHSRVSQLPPGPGRTVWLAAHPGSGTGWLCSILAALNRDERRLTLDARSRPADLGPAGAALGLDPRRLIGNELEMLRSALVRAAGETADRPGEPLLRRTHELYRAAPAGWTWPAGTAPEPFPADATRAAILLVRDPRDVACASAGRAGLDHAGAVEAMGHAAGLPAGPAAGHGEQPCGSWSLHTRSWLAPEVPFPVHLIRTEDLHADPLGTLGPVLAAIGVRLEEDELRRAVDRAPLPRLAAGWREELAPGLAAAVEADHGALMIRLGYEPGTGPQARAELAARRRSARQAATPGWLELPADLGLLGQVAQLPDRLPGARRPRPWAWVSADAILVRFVGGAAVLVRDGHRILVDPGDAGAGRDAGRLVQGWGVTLAMLQRGGISLHAAVFDVHGRVVCVAADEGDGTAAQLRARGHRPLVDAVALVTVVEGHGLASAWVRPYARAVPLLPGDLAAPGLDDADLLPAAGAGRPASIRLDPPSGPPRLIDDVVVLTRSAAAREPVAQPVGGVERIALLRRHTDRDGLAPVILGGQGYFDRVSQLAAAVRVTQLVLPEGAGGPAAAVAVVEGLTSAAVPG